MAEKLLTVDWKTIQLEEVCEYVRKPLLEAGSGEGNENTRKQIVEEALLGARETSLEIKQQIYVSLCANIAAVPNRKVLFSELISMYTRDPEAYQIISRDPFIGDRIYIVSRTGLLGRNEDALGRGFLEDQLYLTSTRWQGSDLCWFKIEPSPAHTGGYFDLLHAPVEEVTNDRKYKHLQVALSLTTMEHVGAIVLPGLWQWVDLGPITAEKLSAERKPLELIFESDSR